MQQIPNCRVVTLNTQTRQQFSTRDRAVTIHADEVVNDWEVDIAGAVSRDSFKDFGNIYIR